MKNLHKGFIVPLVIAVIAVLIIGGGVVVYTKDSQVFDVFYGKKDKQSREYKRDYDRFKKEFPDTIGSYTLYSRGSEKINIRQDCGTGAAVSSETDVEGCTKIIMARYQETGSNNVVFIQAAIEGENQNDVENLLQSHSNYVTIGGYRVLRIERHEIAWVPNKIFDFIVTQEGIWKMNAYGSEMMSYEKLAAGTNAVTQYFLSQFPPKAEE